MLQKYIFNLTCEESGQIHGLGGAELHGLLFSILKEIDQEEANKLHGAVEKPFSLSPLLGRAEAYGNKLRCLQGQTYHFTLSCLDEGMCMIGDAIAKRWPDKTVRLGTGLFMGSEARAVLPPDFCYRQLFSMPFIENDFTLQFCSPTSFRSQGKQILFPLPEKMFDSLQRRWNIFSPVKFQDDTDFSFLITSRYNLSTTLVSFERYKIIGFTGRCSYRISEKYAEIMGSRVSALARFAEICGVGYKTSMSMGDVKLL